MTTTHDALDLTTQGPLLTVQASSEHDPVWWPRRMYGERAGGMHSTRMLSCLT